MLEYKQFYIDGNWVDPAENNFIDVINPYTEKVSGKIAAGGSADVDRAVNAAKQAFASFSKTTVAERVDLLSSILNEYEKRSDDLAAVLPKEMGAPDWLAAAAQVPAGGRHIKQILKCLDSFEFIQQNQGTAICYEPIGVVGMITPWNWPLNQIMCKLAPALAAGCTMMLKPSENAPLNAMIIAEILHSAGTPKGVFNLVNGLGDTVGNAISSHPDVDMVSITGSTRAGIAVAKNAASTVKRVAQELGGKSPAVILKDADLAKAVKSIVQTCFLNSGQNCNAPTRMLVPAELHDEAAQIAVDIAGKMKIAAQSDADKFTLGPLANKKQFERAQLLIQKGIDEGTNLLLGGTGLPDGISRGYFVKPTVFADVSNNATVAREEIFGPVLSIIPYQTEAEAIEIANDTVYGLAAYVYSGDPESCKRVASQIRAGTVQINGASQDLNAPFGGYKQSGNGREWGLFGLKEYLEVKAITGY